VIEAVPVGLGVAWMGSDACAVEVIASEGWKLAGVFPAGVVGLVGLLDPHAASNDAAQNSPISVLDVRFIVRPPFAPGETVGSWLGTAPRGSV
jgi:hypothetical protein